MHDAISQILFLNPWLFYKFYSLKYDDSTGVSYIICILNFFPDSPPLYTDLSSKYYCVGVCVCLYVYVCVSVRVSVCMCVCVCVCVLCFRKKYGQLNFIPGIQVKLSSKY